MCHVSLALATVLVGATAVVMVVEVTDTTVLVCVKEMVVASS